MTRSLITVAFVALIFTTPTLAQNNMAAPQPQCILESFVEAKVKESVEMQRSSMKTFFDEVARVTGTAPYTDEQFEKWVKHVTDQAVKANVERYGAVKTKEDCPADAVVYE